MKANATHIVFVILLFCASVITTAGSDWERVVNLRGYWRFTIGDDMKWVNPNYNDSGWEDIKVPSSWESEGFHGYNGYAWYRTSFEFPQEAKSYGIMLKLGFIDDVDEVYVNGFLVGKSGGFPPNFSTAYNSERIYHLPGKYLNESSENIIAVRVFDAQLDGGIVGGDIGVFIYSGGMKLDINLEGEWKFKTGDNFEWQNEDYDDSEWESIFVPGNWESRGWPNYNGFAWYRIKFFVPENLKGRKYVLVLGKIDDIDETFLNGKKVGFTGKMYSGMRESYFTNEWQQFRGYYLPEGVLKFGEENTIAVRVYDGYINGGIHEGPVGLVTQDIYRSYWRDRKQKNNIWEILFGN